MQLELTGRHLDITPALRRLVTRKVSKLERVLNDSAVSTHVVLSREKHRHLAEINLHARGEKFLHAVAGGTSWEMSLGGACEKLEQQALKIKGKRQRWKGRRAAASATPNEGLEALERSEAAQGPSASRPPTRPRMPRILRASRQAVKEMSVADAVRAVDHNRDGLVVFLDRETSAVSVMYRRNNGELTLVEVEL
ncbi:MAG TPA: ribosome-associated translation inhibitor RaiA [Vicinamibacterales bacterium]|nr:ribosome-associated translation inhibitor RaiA [Vicinamibacterales bacterium]